MSANLNADNAFIFRITHIDNMRWIFNNGIHCAKSDKLDPDFKSICASELINKRVGKKVPISPCGVLPDYISFYFTPFSIMAYNINTGCGVDQVPNSEIVIMVARLRHLLREEKVSALFTDRHAYLQWANFYDSADKLNNIDWRILQNRDFKKDNNDLEKKERYQAEALIYRHLPVDALSS